MAPGPPEDITAIAVLVLNRAFASDPDAIHAIICNRVPCNAALADDPSVVVDKSIVSDVGWNVGMIGIINGILIEMDAPLVGVKFSDEPIEYGRHKILGFCSVDRAPVQ